MLESSYNGLIAILSILVAILSGGIALWATRRRSENAGALSRSLNDANTALQHMALHDRLTHLPNRALLAIRMEEAEQAALRDQARFSILFIGLDGFKAVNDAYGHAVGDLLLIETAQRIQLGLRQHDTVARFAGDEFVTVIQNGNETDIATVAGKIVNLFSRPFQIRNQTLHLSASIGISIFPEDGPNADSLLVNAEAAMYHRKNLGRNGYSFFDISMNTNAEQHLQLVQDLRVALKRNELVLHYQPMFDKALGPITGVEALVRWQHPELGLLGPDHFIPTAEKTGQIIDIDNWVLNEACRQLKTWREEQGHGWTVSINVSPLQFTHVDLVDTVRHTLERYSLPPELLVLEITESTAMSNVNASMSILQRLHELGVKISIDDFGTGYSSLLYLKRLPASGLKIDRGFIVDLAPDTEDAAIVTAIVALGKALKLTIVAEGVETWEQQRFLSKIGCDSLQGFLLGRPVPAEQLIAFDHLDNVGGNLPTA